MAGEWIETTIGDIADVYGGSTPSTKDPENFDGDVPWLTPKDLSGPHPRYVKRGERNLSEKGLRSCSAQLLPANTVLLSSRAPIGYVAIAANPITTNQGFRSLVVKQEYHHEFLYYWLKANVEELERHASGSTFKEISGSSLRKIRLRLPARREEQRAIAHILGTLDDKIELNRRMSETLEQMARALFKSWFVDFDPVRAKMEGRWKRHSPLPANEGPVERSTPLPLGEGKGEGKKHLPSDLLDFARELRKTATDAERLLWRLLRNRALEGAKFRRQHPVPPYVLDFYCHELKLAIEVDGGQHNEPPRKKRDEERTAFLESHGIRVLRFWNREVLHETEGVLEAIYQAIVERRQEVLPSPPTPLPEGEGGYLPAHLYDLFPDRLVDSDLGEIPEGWEVARLSDLCSTQYGYTASALSEPVGPKLLRVTDINKRNWIEWDTVPYCSISVEDKAKYALSLGDIVVARMADPGKSAIVEEQIDAVFASYLVRLKTTSLAHAYYLYGFLKSDAYREYSESATSGSVQANMNAKVIVGAKLLVPPTAVMEAYLHSVLPLRRRIVANLRESRTLTALRDALLPKLISGELRVKDVERFLKERGL